MIDNYDALDGAPTYYPSSSADTATEVAVNAGQETGGIDIRARADNGHDVALAVFPAPPKPPREKSSEWWSRCAARGNGAQVAAAFVGQTGGQPTFSFSASPTANMTWSPKAGNRRADRPRRRDI